MRAASPFPGELVFDGETLLVGQSSLHQVTESPATNDTVPADCGSLGCRMWWENLRVALPVQANACR